jgi:two-component system chemotaxis response regulator CheY
MKVLLTDDSATIRMILKGLLKQLEITDVVEASDGNAALEMLQKTPVDLMLLDIHMPKMDGLACLTALKQSAQTAQLPVVIISSDTAASQLEAAEKLGACAFVQKPFRLEGLRQAVSAACPDLAGPALQTPRN